LNCPYCDSELESEDSTFCPKCEESFEEDENISKIICDKQTDLLLVAGLLSIISAVFIASLGYIGIYQYLYLVDNFGSAIASEVQGFLIFGIIGVLCSIFSLIGSVFILKRKNLIISSFGFIFPIISVIATYITIDRFQYGFTENVTIFSGISVLILSLYAGSLILSNRNEFK
jgi:hypothetical protein